MAKINRKGKVTHITLDPNDLVAQYYVSEGVPAKDLYDYGLTTGYEVIDVEYVQDDEENYVRPKGRDMGHGCYLSKGSPLFSGSVHRIQSEMKIRHS